MKPREDDGCPCTSSCSNHADCDACIDAHASAGSKTACEKLGQKSLKARNARATAGAVKLLDFAPCAG
jgi:hypothetical protein